MVGFGSSVVLAILVCWLLDIASAARLGGITSVIIFLVPHQGSTLRMAASRIGEVGWGVLMAIVVVWLSAKVRQRTERGRRLFQRD